MTQNAMPRNGLKKRGPGKQQPAKHHRSERDAGASRGGDGHREQPERARQAVLRRVIHRPVHAVEPQPVVPPRGHRIDVDVPQGQQRSPARQKVGTRPRMPRHSMRAPRVRRDRSRCGTACRRCRKAEEGSEQQHRGCERVHLQRQLHLAHGTRPRRVNVAGTRKYVQ